MLLWRLRNCPFHTESCGIQIQPKNGVKVTLQSTLFCLLKFGGILAVILRAINAECAATYDKDFMLFITYVAYALDAVYCTKADTSSATN